MQQVVSRLNEAKKRKGMTLKQLAEASQLSQGTVNKIMSGELQSIKPEKLERLANALDVSVRWLTESGVDNAPKGLGIVKIACISPEVRVADCRFNVEMIVQSVEKAIKRGVSIALLPELCITGYSCGDLFFQSTLRNAAMAGLDTLRKRFAQEDIVLTVGLPLCSDSGKLYNAAAVICHGEILGVIPKKNLPNYNEFMEKRHFCAFDGENTTINLFEKDVPFGTNLIFADKLHPEVRFGVEICEDVWVADSPSISHSAAGANAVFNLSASNETVVKSDYRLKMIEIQSAKCGVIYAYCSSGPSESTSATVFSAHNIICENGECLAQSLPFGSGYAEAEADFDFIRNERARLDHKPMPDNYLTVQFDLPLDGKTTRVYNKTPFVPSKNSDSLCERVMEILAFGLKKRLEHTHAQKAVLGISGGCDSALALLVCQRALKLCNRPAEDIIAVTMPCFGTSKRTLENAVSLTDSVGATLRQIDISAAVTQHLKDIGHDFTPDTVFENAQARERTQVLMDIANAENGLVVGTGDLSEAALGWSTFNGDQMSMYAVNASVPKTLVRKLLHYHAEKSHGELKRVLTDILDTPVSPELLPAKNGEISQLTENIVGPYELHDYFLFMLVRKGFGPRKIFELAKLSFDGIYDSQTILDRLKFFLNRFVSQQYKRSCTPDSVKLGSVDLGKLSLRIPSDAAANALLAELEGILPCE